MSLPCTTNTTSSAGFVAWSAVRSMYLAGARGEGVSASSLHIPIARRSRSNAVGGWQDAVRDELRRVAVDECGTLVGSGSVYGPLES